MRSPRVAPLRACGPPLMAYDRPVSRFGHSYARGSTLGIQTTEHDVAPRSWKRSYPCRSKGSSVLAEDGDGLRDRNSGPSAARGRRPGRGRTGVNAICRQRCSSSCSSLHRWIQLSRGGKSGEQVSVSAVHASRLPALERASPKGRADVKNNPSQALPNAPASSYKPTSCCNMQRSDW